MHKLIFLIGFCSVVTSCFAQNDSTSNRVDSFLLNQKGLVGKLARNLMADKPASSNAPVRNDLLFMRYKGKWIRKITIKRLDFGIPITDTSRHFKSTLTQWANDLHHKTREEVIRNNLFFKEGDKLEPYLMADNERHLRDLTYLHDAKITVTRAGKDSVDVLVLTKDVLSIGGSYRMHSSSKMSITAFEDNFAGTGHKILVRTFFDNKRDPKFGYGAEYIGRNIGGSFINGYAGYLSFNKNFNTGKQNEEMAYVGLVRPLVNPYMKFTYAAEAAWHNTNDVYKSDTLYETNTRYSYYNYDAWVGWNTGAFKISSDRNRDRRMRTLLGLRYLQRDFTEVPAKYDGQYYYQYATLKAVLSSVTIFRQDFYKVQNVYGFGRNEDIPEGADLTLTAGWTKKSGVERPYIGIDIQRYFFTTRESYFNYTLKAEGYLRHNQIEDINTLANVEYFSRLLKLGTNWKLRNFINGGITYQAKRILNEPLFLQSDFGVREWRNDTLIAGNTRITLKAESVFFAPWELAKFRFAPFVFGNLCIFTPVEKKFSHSDWYKSFGGGIKTRNESLIFETMEFRAYYFPQRNFFGDYWRLEFNTNIRFKYNSQFVKKPDFISVNVM
ncbi:MAG TPA: hypothetical protein VGQ09_07875 [Chitinophagaceae bacterium]|jgi:hypothetical protein|nr:hypothetical protein [Chitinophagaceae bacterium]